MHLKIVQFLINNDPQKNQQILEQEELILVENQTETNNSLNISTVVFKAIQYIEKDQRL